MNNIIAQGRRGEITLTTKKGVQIATKRARKSVAKGAISKEIDILRYINEKQLPFVPQIIESGDGRFSYKRIEGEHFRDVYKHSTGNHRIALVRALVQRAYQLDTIGVVHGELSNPHTNVLVHSGDDEPIYIIDFERGTLHDYSGKNLKALAQWLRGEGYLTMKDSKQIGSKEMSLSDKYEFMVSKITETTPASKKSYYFIITGIIGLVGLDLLTKYLFYNLERGEESLFLTPVLNSGVGWSVAIPMPVILLVTVVVIGLLFYFLYRKQVAIIPAVLFISGAMGNGIDRLVYQGVRDFLDLQYWPVFNAADIYLTIAILLLLYHTIHSRHERT